MTHLILCQNKEQ